VSPDSSPRRLCLSFLAFSGGGASPTLLPMFIGAHGGNALTDTGTLTADTVRQTYCHAYLQLEKAVLD